MNIKRNRWSREWRVWRFEIEIDRFINHQCVAIGGTLNWNFRPSVEVDALLWRIRIEYIPCK